MNQQPNTQPEKAPTSSSGGGMSAGSIAITVLSVLVVLIYYIGAAKLSYDKHGSIGWAFLAFIFAPIYYPVYAYFVSSRTNMGMLGGLRKMMKW